MVNKLDTIHNEDCVKGMKEIESCSIDLVICDLPYGTTQNKWDTELDLSSIWSEYKRIIKDSGVIILFGQDKFTAKLMLSNDKWHRYNLIWEKDRPSGFLNAKRMPLRSHEDILVFYEKLPTYNPQFWEGSPLHGVGNAFKEKKAINNNYGNFNDNSDVRDARKGETKKYPRSVLRYRRPHPPIHPTQKPTELIEYLIRTYTNEGETVLDNCIGSGTTAIAAINTNRNFIGFELDADYCDIANKRIDEALTKRNEDEEEAE